jgi:hypothetical protein
MIRKGDEIVNKNEKESINADELLKLFRKVRKPSLFMFIFYSVVLLLAIAGLTLMIINGGKLWVKETFVLIIWGGLLILNVWHYFHDRKKALQDIVTFEKDLREIDKDDDPEDEKMTEEENQKLIAPLKRFMILEFTLYGVALLLELPGIILRYINPLLSHIFTIVALCFFIIAFVIYFIYKKRSLIK